MMLFWRRAFFTFNFMLFRKWLLVYYSFQMMPLIHNSLICHLHFMYYEQLKFRKRYIVNGKKRVSNYVQKALFQSWLIKHWPCFTYDSQIGDFPQGISVDCLIIQRLNETLSDIPVTNVLPEIKVQACRPFVIRELLRF